MGSEHNSLVDPSRHLLFHQVKATRHFGDSSLLADSDGERWRIFLHLNGRSRQPRLPNARLDRRGALARLPGRGGAEAIDS